MATLRYNASDIDDAIDNVNQMILKIYPVGAIYISISDTSPASLFGGTWEQIENRFLLAAGSSYTAGSTGGKANVTLTIDQIPKHTHGSIYTGSSGTKNLPWLSGTGSNLAYVEGYAGGGKSHTNMPPYLAVYVWKRVA